MLVLAMLACKPPIDTDLPPDTDVDTDETDDTDDTDDTDVAGLTAPTGSERVVKTCAPDDGPAVRFELGIALDTCEADFAVGSAVLTIDVYGDLTWMTAGTFTLAAGNGSVAYGADKDAAKELATEGTLEITSWTGAGASGTYDFTFPSGHLTGEFEDARSCDAGEVCG
jgi:hypothetical protein